MFSAHRSHKAQLVCISYHAYKATQGNQLRRELTKGSQPVNKPSAILGGVNVLSEMHGAKKTNSISSMLIDVRLTLLNEALKPYSKPHPGLTLTIERKAGASVTDLKK